MSTLDTTSSQMIKLQLNSTTLQGASMLQVSSGQLGQLKAKDQGNGRRHGSPESRNCPWVSDHPFRLKWQAKIFGPTIRF